MTSKERMRIALEGGKPDRVPIAMMLDGSYLIRATGIDARIHGYADNEHRAGVQCLFHNRHPENDLIVAWYGGSRDFGTKEKLVRDGDRFLLEDMSTGKRTELPEPERGGWAGPTA